MKPVLNLNNIMRSIFLVSGMLLMVVGFQNCKALESVSNEAASDDGDGNAAQSAMCSVTQQIASACSSEMETCPEPETVTVTLPCSHLDSYLNGNENTQSDSAQSICHEYIALPCNANSDEAGGGFECPDPELVEVSCEDLVDYYPLPPGDPLPPFCAFEHTMPCYDLGDGNGMVCPDPVIYEGPCHEYIDPPVLPPESLPDSGSASNPPQNGEEDGQLIDGEYCSYELIACDSESFPGCEESIGNGIFTNMACSFAGADGTVEDNFGWVFSIVED